MNRKEWLASEETRSYLKELMDERQRIMDAWAAGQFSGTEADGYQNIIKGIEATLNIARGDVNVEEVESRSVGLSSTY